MRPTADEILAARGTLEIEVGLLRKKVQAGATLRVGERRFLLAMLEPIDQESERIQGAYYALTGLLPKFCSKCREKHIKPYMQDLRRAAHEIGERL